ncbi:MAG: hypothetical protein R2744_04520 [Bacteroidales bacterium]
MQGLLMLTGLSYMGGGDPGLSVSFHNNGDNSARGWFDSRSCMCEGKNIIQRETVKIYRL